MSDTRRSTGAPRLSAMASALVGSEILQIAAEVRALVASGHEIANLTVGDFAASEFRVPAALRDGITRALEAGETNYPPSDGMPALRAAVRALYARELGFEPALESIVVTGGSRPGIYAAYAALCDAGDRVVYPTPSWNNNHYVHLVGATGVPVSCGADSRFLPTRAELRHAVRGARLLALCSPLNPSGTAFTADELRDVCDLVVEENAARGAGERPLYLVYDQVYWTLVFGDTRHVHPIGVCPEIAPYVVYVDGISKSLAATGLRVGWLVAPRELAGPMSAFLGHVGAWAPRPEQVAVAELFGRPDELRAYHATMVAGLSARLDALHRGLAEMRDAGLPVEVIAPEGAIYLSARFALAGLATADGAVLHSDADVRRYLLEAAGAAVVPFHAFGVIEDTGWFRLSVGAVSPAQIEALLPRLRLAIESLRPSAVDERFGLVVR